MSEVFSDWIGMGEGGETKSLDAFCKKRPDFGPAAGWGRGSEGHWTSEGLLSLPFSTGGDQTRRKEQGGRVGAAGEFDTCVHRRTCEPGKHWSLPETASLV